MTDHILKVTVHADDSRQFYIDMNIDGVTFAVLGPYATCPSDDEAQAVALSCVRMDGYAPHTPLFWDRQN